jgi:hypothetical protein
MQIDPVTRNPRNDPVTRNPRNVLAGARFDQADEDEITRLAGPLSALSLDDLHVIRAALGFEAARLDAAADWTVEDSPADRDRVARHARALILYRACTTARVARQITTGGPRKPGRRPATEPPEGTPDGTADRRPDAGHR